MIAGSRNNTLSNDDMRAGRPYGVHTCWIRFVTIIWISAATYHDHHCNGISRQEKLNGAIGKESR